MTNQQITALVTGANRGLGKHFAAQLVERGAKVYAAARRPETIDLPGVIAVREASAALGGFGDDVGGLNERMIAAARCWGKICRPSMWRFRSRTPWMPPIPKA